MSPLIWIQPANIGGLFFARNSPRAQSGAATAENQIQNLYDTARKEMIGFALRSAFDTPSSVPSAALMMTDDVVFSGIYVTDATSPQCSVMLYARPALNIGAHEST
ncbi:hypothetical protein OKW41_008097 [Paraburkholderia sp. UCT70]